MTATDILTALVAVHGNVLSAIYEENLTDDATPAKLGELADSLITVSALAPDGWASAEDVELYDLDALWMDGFLASEPVREDGWVRVVLA